jgi:hypothetical protein
MKALSLVVFFIIFTVTNGTAQAATKETPHLQVVKEYVRSLAAVYNIQETSRKEFDEINQLDENMRAQSRLMRSIKSGTKMNMELKASIGMLKGMKLHGQFDTLIPTTIDIYKQKISLHDELISMSKRMLGMLSIFSPTPKDFSDMKTMSGRMPELEAQLEYLDETLFKMMVLVFALLIDEIPDSQGHMSHLIISKAEKQELLQDIDLSFGPSLDKKDKNYTVSSAALIKGWLQKYFVCTDDWKKSGK